MNRLGQLRHLNLTPLLGFCLVEDEKLLVYKYMSNGTLFSMLNGNASELDWETRFSTMGVILQYCTRILALI